MANRAEDSFEGAYVPTPDQRALANDAFRRLQGEGFDRDLLEKVAAHLLSAPSQVLAAMRPYALADEWKVDRAALLELFLHAAHLGVLTIAWDVICPKCLVAHETVGELAGVTRIGTCDACVNTYERDLSASVELVFRPDARIRETERVTYCVGAPALRPHVLVQQVLDPGEVRTVSLRLDQGVYRVIAGQSKTDVTHPTFRDFFGDELIGYGEHLNVSRITFLFLEAEERARVFAELGDVRACELFEELDRVFREQLFAEEGTDVAAPLGLSVAAFAHPQRAVQAGIGLLRAAQTRMGTPHGSVRVRMAVHEGPLPRAHPRRPGRVLRRDHAPRRLAARRLPPGQHRHQLLGRLRSTSGEPIHGASLVTSIIESTHGPYQGRRVMLAALPDTHEREAESGQPTVR